MASGVSVTRQLAGQHFSLSPAVGRLLGLIRGKIEIFPPALRLSHDRLEIDIPEGALHWGSVVAFPEKDWGSLIVRIDALGTRIDAACPLRESSDLTAADAIETLWDPEDHHSAYAIINANLCLADAKQLIVCLVAGFYPWSINIRTIETTCQAFPDGTHGRLAECPTQAGSRP